MDVVGGLFTALHWVDRHNGFAQAVGTGCAAIVACLALMVAVHDARTRTRPVFSAHLRKGDTGEVELVVENTGGAPAKDVDLDFEDEIPRFNFGSRKTHNHPLLVPKLPQVYVDRRLREKRTLVVTYRGYRWKRYRQTFPLDPLSLDSKIHSGLTRDERKTLRTMRRDEREAIALWHSKYPETRTWSLAHLRFSLWLMGDRHQSDGGTTTRG